MTTARELHDKAMDSAFFAMRERTQGNSEEAARLFEQAFAERTGRDYGVGKPGPNG